MAVTGRFLAYAADSKAVLNFFFIYDRAPKLIKKDNWFFLQANNLYLLILIYYTVYDEIKVRGARSVQSCLQKSDLFLIF